MARNKKEVNEVNEFMKEAQEAQVVQAEENNVMLSPLPGAETVVKAQEAQEAQEEQEVKAVEVKKEPKAKKWYGACRISGGLTVDILVDGEQKKIMFKSANTSKLGADGTRTFQFNPDKFGIIELSAEDAKACLERLKPMNCFKRGFVLIADNMEDILAAEKANVSKYPQQGTEQELSLKGAVVEAFDADK